MLAKLYFARIYIAVILIAGVAVLLTWLAGCFDISGRDTSFTTDPGGSVSQEGVVINPYLQEQSVDAVFGNDWLMLFEGVPVFENDFRFVAGLTGLDVSDAVARQETLYLLIEFMTVIHHANSLGLGVTVEDHDTMLPSARFNIAMIGLDGLISDERLVEFFAAGELLSRLVDYYVVIDTPDIADYTAEFAVFVETNQNLLTDINVQYIVSQDMFELVELRERLLSDGVGDFTQYVRELSVFYEMDGGAVIYSLNEFAQIFLMYNHDRAALYRLRAGDVSHVFNIEDFFFLVYAVSREDATDDEIEAAFIDSMLHEIRQDAIWLLVDEWMTAANYEVNQSLLDAMR